MREEAPIAEPLLLCAGFNGLSNGPCVHHELFEGSAPSFVKAHLFVALAGLRIAVDRDGALHVEQRLPVEDLVHHARVRYAEETATKSA